MSFLEKAFELSVVVQAVDKFTAPSKRVQDSLKQTDKQIKDLEKAIKTASKNSSSDLEKLNKEMEKLTQHKKNVEELSKSFDNMKKTAVAGAVVMATGIKMASGIEDAVGQASKLLTIMTSIQIATGASEEKMQGVKDTITQTSAVTKYDKFQTAGFANILATSGYNLDETEKLLPVFTRYAEVQEYGKGTNPEEGIKKAIELAHGMGKYDPESLEKFLNEFNKATFMQPEDTVKFGETLKYAMTTGKSFQMSDNDILFMSALSNRMGLAGSMGGTNAADMLIRSIPGISGGLKPKITKDKHGNITDVQYPRQLQAMMDVGLGDKYGNSPFFQDGKLIDLAGFISTLFEHTKNLNPEQKVKTYHDIFGQQGARAAELFGSEQGQKQLEALIEGSKHIKSIGEAQDSYLQMPEGQANQLKSNMQNLKMDVFTEMAQQLNPLLKNINALVEKIMVFSKQHPTIAKYTATFALIGTAAMLILGPIITLVSSFMMLRTGMALLGLTKVAGQVSLLGRVLVALGLPFRLIGTISTFIGQRLWNFGMTLVRIGPAVLRAMLLIARGMGMAFGAPLILFGKGILMIMRLFGSMTAFLGKTLIQLLAWAARMAVMWLISMGPIGWIIMGVIAIVALLVVAWKKNWGNIQGITQTVVAWIVTHFNSMVDWLKELPNKALQAGKDFMAGLKNGIMNGIESVKNVMATVKDSVVGRFKSLLGINSPSKVMMEHGKYITQGLALGMSNNAGIVGKASLGLAGQVSGGMDTALSLNHQGGGTGGTTIVINPHPHQRVEEIAEAVMQKLGNSSRRMNMNMGISINPGAF